MIVGGLRLADPGRNWALSATVLGAKMTAVAREVTDPSDATLAESRCLVSAGNGDWLCFSGQPLETSSVGAKSYSAGDLMARLQHRGPECLPELRGSFAIAWFDSTNQELVLIRDAFGIEPLFVSIDENGAAFGSRLPILIEAWGLSPVLDPAGVADFLRYCFIPGDGTLFQGISAVPPGSALRLGYPEGRIRQTRVEWFQLSYDAMPKLRDENAIIEEYKAALESAVARSLVDSDPGIMLSGGMDSSAIASLVVRNHGRLPKAFSFRCATGKFDESQYAIELARQLGLAHETALYGAQDVFSIESAVGDMDTPFCDAGIEIGTWLVAQSAAGQVHSILTGDGGDELWASHPVYAAQRLIRIYDRLPIPMPVRSSLKRLLDRVGDSDEKRDLRVILKRLLPEPTLPPSLKHHRWRVYYLPPDLAELMGNGSEDHSAAAADYSGALSSFEGFRGDRDRGDDMLYSDYRFAMAFYLRRLLLFRGQGIEARLPFLDIDLVNLGTRIPFRLKLEGIERTKRIFRSAMRGVVPDLILDRKDKLGHSIPLKNWLRVDEALRERIRETLIGGIAGPRGLVEKDPVERLFKDHVSGRANHSHRIWALFVLDRWLAAHRFN